MLNKLKSDYEELEIKPSSDLWERLEGKLVKEPEIVLKPAFQWWKYAAVVIFLISFGSLFYFNRHKTGFNDKPTEYIVKKNVERTMTPIHSEFEHQAVVSNEEKVIKNEGKFVVESHTTTAEDVSRLEKENTIIQSQISEDKPQQFVNVDVQPAKVENQTVNLPLFAEAKKEKTKYINADELLLGREFDKTREENQNVHKQFGVLDASKIKVKSPNSLKILGFTIFSDSLK
ncbi:hypothetical protein PFY12_02665 [Chryseobacterium camelliae]|uniref:Anti-sigma factor n=1 Tax=Chryseobacterium camelliae TaxID=1265445 RepID=A0ABY7QPX9_9FLAO|nr:hypothetical protein [Chryseobacterium camelliae]WBV61032.1 hypothetical protein PFY12_02665 [Chryseobacterium camelliae]